MEILIVGAGIGGLSLAIGLVAQGHRVRILEGASELRPIGAGLLLQPNAWRALVELGIDGAVEAAGVPVSRGRMVRPDGRVIQELDLTFGGERKCALGIHRGKLQEILLAALPAGIVELDSRARCVQDGQVVLDDGSRHAADVIVGADGLHSSLAESLGCPPLRYAGYTCWRGVSEMVEEEPLSAVTEAWGKGSRFGYLPLGDGRIYWFATQLCQQGTRVTKERSKSHLLDVFADYSGMVRPLIEATHPSNLIQNDIVDRAPRTVWGEGNVTFLGDAAHPMTPNLGQGACQALEDAVCLSRHLKQGTGATALRAYEQERMAPTAKIVKMSLQMGRMAQLQNAFARWLRDLVLAWTPQSVQKRQILELVG